MMNANAKAHAENLCHKSGRIKIQIGKEMILNNRISISFGGIGIDSRLTTVAQFRSSFTQSAPTLLRSWVSGWSVEEKVFPCKVQSLLPSGKIQNHSLSPTQYAPAFKQTDDEDLFFFFFRWWETEECKMKGKMYIWLVGETSFYYGGWFITNGTSNSFLVSNINPENYSHQVFESSLIFQISQNQG